MTDGNNSGCGCGWVILIAVVAVIGTGFLYQREGNKIFGPGGVVGPPPPPKVFGLDATFDTGLFSHDLLLKNGSGSDLGGVDLKITLHREDGQQPVVKQYWSKWMNGEAKKINVPSHRYQKVFLQGKAYRGNLAFVKDLVEFVNGVEKGGKFEEVTIDESWTWTWGK